MPARARPFITCLALASAAALAAQPLDRLSGRVMAQRGYLSAAISEMNKAHNVMKGTY